MKIGVLCGGGPAPGFNGVIHAVVHEATSRGFEVIGIPYGYSRLMAGDVSQCKPLTPADVEGIDVQGGGILFTNRANPKKSPETMAAVVASVQKLGLDALVTIGGDDTATSAAAVAEAAGNMRVAHVPKTIDNDLPLPEGMPTFGFETAKQLAGQLCRNLRTDARTTGRWYVVTAMGRSAGHLAMGMADEADADLCVIREEFPDDHPITLDAVADIVQLGIENRAAEGQGWGLVVFGEGILERLAPEELKSIAQLELDEHGNPRMSEIDLGKAVVQRLETRGSSTKFVTKLIGYELRGADPVPFDVAYTGQLGAGAVAFLAEGEGNGIITVQGGAPVPLRFEDLVQSDGRIPVRRVDPAGDAWKASLARQAR